MSCLLLASAHSGQDKADIVEMENGDRLTCEIKGLSGGVLYLSLDYVDGTVSVNWSKVARLVSKRQFIVRTDSGLVHTGTLATLAAVGSKITSLEVIASPGKGVLIDVSRIATVERTAKTFWRRLNGDFAVGLNYSKGNNSTQYNISTSLEYPTERWSAQVDFNSTLTSNSDSRTSTRNQLDIGFSRLMRQKNYFYSGISSFLQSSERSIDLQTTIGGGIGHYFKNTGRARVSVVGGLAWQKTNYNDLGSGQASQNALAGLIATEARLFKFKKTSLTFSAAVLPSISEPGRYYSKLNQSLKLKLFGDFTWNISVYGNWDNRPPAGLSGSDYGTSAGVGWTFGNR
jgi:hypothetical protein